jgi:hypothetical protein
MVSTHIVQRHFESRDQVSEVFRREITAGEDEVDGGKPSPVDSLVKGGMHIV